jgi:hypothetical protein
MGAIKALHHAPNRIYIPHQTTALHLFLLIYNIFYAAVSNSRVHSNEKFHSSE